jgi:hypothetical protein
MEPLEAVEEQIKPERELDVIVVAPLRKHLGEVGILAGDGLPSRGRFR